MVGEVLQGALSGDNGLDEESEHGEHGQPTVLQFLHLQLSESLGVVSETQWVEAATGVDGVSDLTERPTGNTVTLDGAHEDHLGGPDGEDALSVDETWVAQVVEPTLAEDLGTGFEPHGLAEFHAVAGQEFGEDAAQGSEHGPPRVDDFQLTVPGEGFWVSGKPSSVPTVVAWELAGEVAWGLAGEWAQVLDTVWAVPRASGGDLLGDGLPHADPPDFRG